VVPIERGYSETADQEPDDQPGHAEQGR